MKHDAFEQFTTEAEDGFPISCYRRVSTDSPKAIVHILHGIAEHGRRYAHVAEVLAAAGFAVYAHDHRGHGGSVDGSAPLGHFADEGGWIKVLSDVDSVNRGARTSHSGLPMFVLGHSMGSIIARQYTFDHARELTGTILSATASRIGPLGHGLVMLARREAKKNGKRTPSKLMAKVMFGSFNLWFWPNRTEFDWLTRDRSVVDEYIADPRCGFLCSGQLWADALAGTMRLEEAEKANAEHLARTPFLLIVGTEDPVSLRGLGHTQLVRIYEEGGNVDVEDRRYTGGRHELLNETNREVVLRDIIDWLSARLPTSHPPKTR